VVLPASAALLVASPASAESAAGGATDHFLQYGAGFATELLASAGSVCASNSGSPCILGPGPGLGLAIRVGYRARGPFFVGGAYEFSRQDSSNLLRLAVLQQLRGEARYYVGGKNRLTPYFGFGAGGVLYGNEWGADTFGVTAYLGLGAEFQVSRTSVVGAAAMYRPIVFRHWEDGTGQVRADGIFGFGVAHFVGLELVFEVRDPLSRW
jgi:hypothetical protein